MIHDFEKFVGRHGEPATQALLEKLERYEGIRTDISASLEQRWQNVMWDYYAQQQMAA